MTDQQGRFRHLGLKRWPFSLVPIPGQIEWFGRPALKADVDRLLWQLARRPTASLHLIWADVGSGKSHTLRYIEDQVHREGSSMRTALALMPRGSRGFVDVYGALARQLDFSGIAANFAAIGFDTPQALDLAAPAPDVGVAARSYWMSTPSDRALILQWFVGNREVPRNDLRRLGITQHIRTADSAVASLSVAVTALLLDASRVVLMIDEAQRIGTVRTSVTAEICTGLQGLYNAVPERLSIVMAFSFGDQTHLAAHLTPELLSREDHRRIAMPELGLTEAIEFIVEMLASAQEDDSLVHALGRHDIEEGVKQLVQLGVSLTPRNLIKAFDAVLGEIDYLGVALSDEQVGNLLAAIAFDTTDET